MEGNEQSSVLVERLGDGNFAISVGDQRICHEVVRLVLLLAHCQTPFIPAFILFRANYAFPTWSLDGEIIFDQTHLDCLPAWPNKIFELSDDDSESPNSFSSQSVGLSDLTLSEHSLPLTFKWHRHVLSLCQANALWVGQKYSWTTLTLSERLKEEILSVVSATESEDALSDTLLLLIHSMPDAYAESQWKSLYLTARRVIKDCVVPFLAIISKTTLDKYCAKTATRLPWVLVSHFLSEEDLVNGLTPLSSEVRLWLEGNLNTAEFVGDVLEIIDMVCCIGREVGAGSVTVDIALLMKQRSDRGDLRFNFALLVWHVLERTLKISPVERVMSLERLSGGMAAQQVTMLSSLTLIVSEITGETHNNVPGRFLMKLNIHNRIALAFALSSYKRHQSANLLLKSCSKALSKLKLNSSLEFGLVSAELVTSLNALNREQDARAQAESAMANLQTMGVEQSRYDYLCLSIALADTYIGQGIYDKAQKVLSEILTKTNNTGTADLRCVTALRMTKVERRANNCSSRSLVSGISLRIAVECLDDTDAEVCAEAVQELGSLRDRARWSSNKVQLKEIKDIVLTARLKLRLPKSQFLRDIETQLLDIEGSIDAVDAEENDDSNFRGEIVQKQTRQRISLYDYYDLDEHSEGNREGPGKLLLPEYREESLTRQPSTNKRNEPTPLPVIASLQTERINPNPSVEGLHVDSLLTNLRTERTNQSVEDDHVDRRKKIAPLAQKSRLPFRNLFSRTPIPPPYLFPENTRLYRPSDIRIGELVVSLEDPQSIFDSELDRPDPVTTSNRTGPQTRKFDAWIGEKHVAVTFEIREVNVVRQRNVASFLKEIRGLRFTEVTEYLENRKQLDELYIITSTVIYEDCLAEILQVKDNHGSIVLGGVSPMAGDVLGKGRAIRATQLDGPYVASIIAHRVRINRSKGFEMGESVQKIYFGPVDD